MDESSGSLVHQQLTLAFGALAGLSFAGLVLILEDPKPFTVYNNVFLTPDQSFDATITGLSVVTILLILSTLSTAFAGAGIVDEVSSLGQFGVFSGIGGLFLFVVIIIVIIGDFTNFGMLILIGVVLFVFPMFVYTLSKSIKEKLKHEGS